jgi:hypothetical protein
MTQHAKNNENNKGNNFRAIVAPCRNHWSLLLGCFPSLRLVVIGGRMRGIAPANFYGDRC